MTHVPAIVLTPVTEHKGPGKVFRTNLIEVLRALSKPEVGVEALIGPAK
jgi:hypothetical protein